MILVTGASGFLGLHLLEALSDQGTPVKALYFHAKNLPEFPNVLWEQCDLSDVLDLAEKMEGIQQVYNCAATVSFNPKDKYRLIRDNVRIVGNVVNAALDAGVEKMVHVSSIASLGRKKEGNGNQIIDENGIFEEGNANSKYAIGKYFGEMEVWRGIAEGLHAVIVNPAIILGVGDWKKGSAKLMQICYDEFPWFTEGKTAWVAAGDVVKAMILLMESRISGERFVLSEGNYTYKEVFTQMAVALRKRPPYKKASSWMSEIVWWLSSLKSKLKGTEATITKETSRAAQQQYAYDNHKFLNAFPDFQYTPIATTIQEMAKQFLNAIQSSKEV